MNAHPLSYLIGTVMLATVMSAMACGDVDFRGDAVTTERDVPVTVGEQQAAIQVVGAGWFHAAEVVKKGGSSDNTSVIIELDGEQMFSTSFSTLKNAWMQQESRYFLANVRTEGNTSTMTIWYSPELKFRGIMALRIGVQETGVDALRVRAVLNKPAPHVAGQSAALTLPAFK
jgi:hypothetical protein